MTIMPHAMVLQVNHKKKTAVIRTLKKNGHKLLKIFNSCAVIDHDHRFLPAYVDQVICCQ